MDNETEQLEQLEREFGARPDYDQMGGPRMFLEDTKRMVREGYKHFMDKRGLKDYTREDRIQMEVNIALAKQQARKEGRYES